MRRCYYVNHISVVIIRTGAGHNGDGGLRAVRWCGQRLRGVSGHVCLNSIPQIQFVRKYMCTLYIGLSISVAWEGIEHGVVNETQHCHWLLHGSGYMRDLVVAHRGHWTEWCQWCLDIDRHNVLGNVTVIQGLATSPVAVDVATMGARACGIVPRT